MPKNITGGNKAKKGKNNPTVNVQKELIYADKSGYQFYAVIENFMGHSAKLIMQLEYIDATGKPKTELKPIDGIIRGKIMKKCKPKKGDVMLVCTREFSSKFVDIIHKYTEDNIKDLKKNRLFIDEFSMQIDALHSVEKINSKQQEDDNICFDEEFEPQNRNYELDSSSESDHE